jgi:hypothetical protein
VDPRAGLDAVVKKKIPSHCRIVVPIYMNTCKVRSRYRVRQLERYSLRIGKL